jgi:V-type H+-transporting ATPase proteolipid subunit
MPVRRLTVSDSVPVIMAGIIAIYGLVVSVMITNQLSAQMHIFKGFIQFGAGLTVGLSGLAAGMAIGITGDAGVRGSVQQPRLYLAMMMMQIFSEVLG